MLYFDREKFWKRILGLAQSDDVESMIISSYGMYAGISDTGENTAERYNFDKTIQQILDVSKHKKVVFLLSDTEAQPCMPGCVHCIAKNQKKTRRNEAHINHWPNVSWFITQDHHLKTILFKKKDGTVLGFSGGRNFSNSDWEDVSFELPEDASRELLSHVISLIKTKSVKVEQ